MTDLQEVVETHRDIAQQQLEVHQDQLVIQRDTVKQKLSGKQNECLQLFRLTNSTEDTTYEWYKDRVEDRVEDTCMWFLQHDHFQEWTKQESGPLLVSADPGCGKSVLAKHLIDNVLPRSATICYFFFKDQDQSTVRQALCALLHQLFSQKPVLIQHAMKQFEKDGRGLIGTSKSLWAILEDAVRDSQAGPVIIVLDALDECAEEEFENLMRNLESQMRSNQLARGRLKYLLTSRPYEQIVSKFRGLLDAFPRIHIPGEEESETISQEVNRVIEFRVERLATEKALSDRVKDRLAGELLKMTHRTYLWVYLVFDYLKTEDFKKTPKGVQSIVESLPKSVNQAYERILNKSKEPLMVRRALSIILAAGRPLSLWEMNFAVNIDETVQTLQDLDLEEENHFKSRLRSWCGLFVSVYHGKIYFLHQTARDFLLNNLPLSSTISPEARWQRSITVRQAHNLLAELCVRYLNFFNSDTGLRAGSAPEASHQINSQAFLDYSAKFWGLHFRDASIDDEDTATVRVALKLIDPDSKAYSVWSDLYWGDKYRRKPSTPTGLIVAACLGHTVTVKLLLDTGVNINAWDREYGNALEAASVRGYEAIVKQLIDKDADIDAQVVVAAARNYLNGKEIMTLLLDRRSADVQITEQVVKAAAGNGDGGNLILHLHHATAIEVTEAVMESAATSGQESVLRLFEEWAGTRVVSQQWKLIAQFCTAASTGDSKRVVQLAKQGIPVDSKDIWGATPLWNAASGRHIKSVQALLATNAVDVNAADVDGRTPLFWPAANGYIEIVKLLLDHGAEQDYVDVDGKSPFTIAQLYRRTGVLSVLETYRRDDGKVRILV